MKIEKRTERLRIVREMNKVPGVLFGKHFTPVSIQVDELELQTTYKEFGKTQTFTAKLGKENHLVYIKDIQRDIINRNHFLSVELLKVGKGDIISAKIPIHVTGKEAIERQGHLVQIIFDTVEVDYEVGKDVPHLEIDVSNMKIKDVFHIKDLVLPNYLKLVDDPEKVLIHIAESRAAEVVEEAAKEEKAVPETEEPVQKQTEEKNKDSKN